jgi:hypothetical protein
MPDRRRHRSIDTRMQRSLSPSENHPVGRIAVLDNQNYAAFNHEQNSLPV